MTGQFATRRSPLDNARQATLSWVRSRMLDTIQVVSWSEA